MRVLVIGSGSIAQRHAKNVRTLLPEADIGLLRRDFAAGVPDELKEVISWLHKSRQAAVDWQPNYIIVCSPSTCHVSDVQDFAKEDCKFLVEKPIATSVSGAKQIQDCCLQNKANYLVGYNFRYCSVFIAAQNCLNESRFGRLLYARFRVGQFLPDWRPQMDYRKSVSAQKQTGGGALLELSHELDLALATIGMPHSVIARIEKLSDLDIDVEDYVDLWLDYPQGSKISVSLDMCRRDPFRYCEWVGTEGTLKLNLLNASVEFCSGTKSEKLHCETLLDRNQMYLEEMKYFLRSCPFGWKQNNHDAIAVLKVIEAARESNEQKKFVAII